MLEIIPVTALKDNYIWIIKNKLTSDIVIIDPSEHAAVLKLIESKDLNPLAILITHHHWDHVGGINGILEKYDIPVYTPKKEKVKGSTNPVSEGDMITLDELGLKINVIDVPGHTLGAVAYYARGMLFSGDTLFTAGCGRLFEGTAEQMYNSLSKINALPNQTLIFCGHEYTVANLKFAAAVESDNKIIKKRLDEALKRRKKGLPTVPATLKIENQTNPFLRCNEQSIIDSVSNHAGKSINDPVEVFATIRNWKDSF